MVVYVALGPPHVRRARVMVSRRLVVPQSVGFGESNEGATLQQLGLLLSESVEPRPARACGIPKDQVLTFGLSLTDKLDVT